MKMKDVLEKTGLTDRAVRLYIEEGLLSPMRESNYVGRQSITFSEEDVSVLQTVATLRRADFSIAAIREMQTNPDRAAELLTEHRTALSEEIELRREILATLSAIPDDVPLTCEIIADHIRAPASCQNIPKEDSAMLPRDFKTMLRRRTPALLSLIFLILSVIQMTSLAIRCAFVTPSISSGGTVSYNYAFSVDAAAQNILVLAIPILLISAAVCMTVRLLGGHRILSFVSLALGITAAAILLLLPTQSKEAMFLYEFHDYRFSIMHEIFYYAEGWFDVFLKTLKFVPILISTACMMIGLCTEREEA